MIQQFSRRRFLHVAAGAAGLAVTASRAQAQAYPARPINMVVPVSAGGTMDTIARIVAERMRPTLGQPVVIENVTGASGTIAVGQVARASPDGYTLSYGAWATHVVNGAIYKLNYDALNDFEPVALTASSAWLVAAKSAVPANNLQELIDWLRAHPDVTCGTSGAGGPGHVAGVLFQKLTGTRFQFVPYRGVAPAMQDLVAGTIDILIADPITGIPQFRAGKIKVYAVTAKARRPAAPEIPTVDEAGLPGLYMAPWHGIWAPKGTPKPIIDVLNKSIVEGLADPAAQQRLSDLGADVPPREQQTPEAFGAYHKAEIEKWWPIIKETGIKPGG